MAVETYGDRLRAARRAAGLSLEEATYQVRNLMGRKLTQRTVERLELDPRPEDRADERLVVGLCRVYGVDPGDISPVIAERADRLSVLLARNRSPHAGSSVDGGAVTDGYTRAA